MNKDASGKRDIGRENGRKTFCISTDLDKLTLWLNCGIFKKKEVKDVLLFILGSDTFNSRFFKFVISVQKRGIFPLLVQKIIFKSKPIFDVSGLRRVAVERSPIDRALKMIWECHGDETDWVMMNEKKWIRWDSVGYPSTSGIAFSSHKAAKEPTVAEECNAKEGIFDRFFKENVTGKPLDDSTWYNERKRIFGNTNKFPE